MQTLRALLAIAAVLGVGFLAERESGVRQVAGPILALGILVALVIALANAASSHRRKPDPVHGDSADHPRTSNTPDHMDADSHN